MYGARESSRFNGFGLNLGVNETIVIVRMP
jgi:hypothetical protein